MLALLGLPGLPPAALHAADAPDAAITRIGVLAHRRDNLRRWQPTAAYLERAIPGHRFAVATYDLDALDSAVARNQMDLVITSPGSYIELESRYGVTRILTLKSREGRAVLTTFGSVIFTRSGRTDIRELSDLRGKSFAAVDPAAFGGFLIAWDTLRQHGINPYRDFRELHFLGTPQDRLVEAVLAGEVDAAVVRTGLLESLEQAGKLRPNRLRVLNAQSVPGFPFALSTRLYPEWPLARLRHTPEALAVRVAVALLVLPEDSPAARAADSAGWTVPLDYTPVHELYRSLRVGVYRDLGDIEPTDVFRQYWPALLALALVMTALMAVIGHIQRLNVSLRGSEQALRRSARKLQTLNRKLAQLSHIDELTGIANRRMFERQFAHEWSRARRKRNPLALLMVDIDHFKALNDRYGHAAGDRCLKKIAATLERGVRRPGDLVARYGGEEFVLILPDVDSRGAFQIGESLRRAVQALAIPNERSPSGPTLTISVGGAALVPAARANRMTLLTRADRALYRAKRDGRNRVLVPPPARETSDPAGASRPATKGRASFKHAPG